MIIYGNSLSFIAILITIISYNCNQLLIYDNKLMYSNLSTTDLSEPVVARG